MSIEKLAARYIDSADQVCQALEFDEQPTSLQARDVRRVADIAKTYLDDAKHFMRERRFEVSLTAVAYCEGLLDALRLLGAVRFEWPSKVEPERKG